MIDLTKIATEKNNSATKQIDKLSTIKMLKVINDEDKKVAQAIEKALPAIAKAVDMVTACLEHGGRLFYLGAGTSGRLGILDAVECPPTYRTDPGLVIGLIAGGEPAIFRAQEGAEDNPAGGEADLAAHDFTAKDILVGIAASGRTPYVVGALSYAKKIGAKTIALVCSPESPAAAAAELEILVLPGAEVITGSTRMKAGTAQKMVLNMISTGTMIKLGKVYGNLMVDVKTSNDKLKERAINIVMETTGVSRQEAAELLAASDNNVKLTIFSKLSGLPLKEASIMLNNANGHISKALEQVWSKEESK